METLRRDVVDSTNDEAFRLSAEKDPPFIVVASRQFAGRGQGDRSWYSEDPGNLYWTILWRPRQIAQDFRNCSTKVAILLSQALRERYRVPVALKYPNDLMIQGRKLGGILTETRVVAEKLQLAVCGVGLNVNGDIERYPEDIRPHCCRLRDWLPGPLEVRDLEGLLEEIFSRHFL
ncbi:MAG: biotin--[acetyl-CoA-carboxylase] ligase [Puniceicoccales bacterium]|jgi:BirA family biotin operon repressor/biotin-[acetyl-CoA-carboxylase] ligase|nr:biotin--[acetyl-CoA-carboxylase] ligase [Puniceicoccales bacterium]